MSQKPHLNLIVIGHIDHGKSTLVGRLLMDRGFIDEKTVKEAEEAAKKLGKESEKFAFLLDRLKEERERGVTINLTFMRFETKKYFFTIIDAPGHRDFVKNMITGASQADAAILVVSAKKGEYEAGMSVEGQTREHIILAKTMGLDQLIVAVNKMDLTDPPYDEKRYKEIVDQVSKFMRSYGFNTNKVRFVPVVAPAGDNITHRSENMKWYNGPTLEEYLDQLELPPKPVDKPLRIPIQDVYSISGVGTVPVGRVESGVLKVGDKIVFMPAGKVGEVRSIETHHTKMDKAEPGDNIGFNVRGVEKKDIKRGDVVGHPNNPPTVADEFTARIIVVWHPTALANGYTPVIHVHTASVACRVSELVSKLDPRTGQEAEKNPQFLKQGDVAIVKFKPIKPLCVEKYNEFPPLGRFAMRDMGKTVGVGIIVDVKPAKVEIK
ncbi:translation elongation factor EF-1 subunit alpha [Saccharolobus solfataricus]|uniref:Elongation factor 1-alpha n=2 Tax=Saccharolobus solfataricus TaxID=2287 RepID=A0A0E3K8N3_SACSO|nr:translation elongation factor EF-1 subunit alpha [Saccharolobus solfataricus]AKA73541.1 translation elongation factor EF-1 subunit alpha [Saccharolobus solfataricus]AKA76239.1 translation elongation factor EF-1 subunit alpha [Saccharolobus solfataricus]AKA78931.1 translation elongation factor EF-1 subunit alpha [Saccharolobus solfataricus]AZF68010.1 translation elongation factor EF-1 subunit alpha [Saccharolobus solfataricus]AZF70630.1 translation elongation factor EF-1 subunit alpha [Sacch